MMRSATEHWGKSTRDRSAKTCGGDAHSFALSACVGKVDFAFPFGGQVTALLKLKFQ